MRFSTFGIVAATFAAGVYGYSSVFSVADNRQAAVGPAGWLTFVDGRQIVQSAPHHLDRESTQEIRVIDAEQAVVFGHSGPVRARPLERRVASLGNSSLAPTLSPSVLHPPKKAVLNTLPPLPVRGPARSNGALNWSAFRKATKEQNVVVVLPGRKVLPVAGSGRNPMREGLHQKVASAPRAKPSFDTFTRSSLGGPPVADRPAGITTGSIAPPTRLVKKAAPQPPKTQFTKLADDPPRSAATIGASEAAVHQRRVLRTPRRLTSIDAAETPLPPSQQYSNEQLPPARGPQLAATDDTWVSESRTINARQDAAARRKAQARRIQHTRRAQRLDRRAVQRRRADARRRHASKRRSARRPRHVRRRGGRNYRQFQAWRNRTIANQLRLRRRIRGIY